MDGAKEKNSKETDKSVTIQGWRAKAHISCKRRYGLVFKHARNRLLSITLSNLVFHDNGIVLFGVSCSSVVITNCKFMNCQIAVGIAQEESRVCTKSSLSINDTEFLYNTKSVIAYLFNEFFTLTISKCVFRGKVGRFNVTSEDRSTMGAVYIKSKSRKCKVHVSGSITDCIFRELAHEYNGFALSFRLYNLFTTGNLSVLNSTFLNNENGIFVYGGFNVRLTQVTINYTYGYAFIASGPPKIWANVADINVFLDYCIFANNRIGIRMNTNVCLGNFTCSPSSKSLVVKNSLFVGSNETRGNGDTIRFKSVHNSDDSYRPVFIKAVVVLKNVTFQELRNSALYARVQKNANVLISVNNCKFLNSSFQPTVQIEFLEEDPLKCLEQNQSSKFILNKRSRKLVIIEDSTFEGNVGFSGALIFVNGNVTLKNCFFKDNAGLTLGGHVHMRAGYGGLNIINSNFLQTRLKALSNISNVCFVYSESSGPVTVTNSTFTANVNRKFYPILGATRSSSISFDTTSTIRCPTGRRVKLDQSEVTDRFEFERKKKKKGFGSAGDDPCWMKLNFVKIFCEECPDTFYSLQRGWTTGLKIKQVTECLKCPYGAWCENGKVKAKDNFWGLNISTIPPRLQYFRCPLEYCISPSNSNYYVYNGCHGSRTGVLCGKCLDGYSEALYSTSCRKNMKCYDHWFWLASAIYVVVFASYLVFKPPILSQMYKQSLWFKRKPTSSYASPFQHEDNKPHDSGYLKIIFYFYQVAELVMIKSPEETLHMVPIIPPVIAIFNFQVKTLDGSIGCPFPGLTVVTKELFRCLKFLATLISIGFIYAIHRAASTSRYICAPSLALYLAVALETLLLGYERLADTTLKLMHCVPMGTDWRLFVDGNIPCWQWWQYLLIAFIVAFIVPLVLVLFWGSLMLAKDKVTAKGLLTACVFPLPCLIAWIVRHYKNWKTQDEEMLFAGNFEDVEQIKEVLHGPFREASNGDSGTLYWESVLTGRRLILLTIHTFITDPMTRFFCLNCASVLFLIHHLAMRPFRDRKANICEGFSLMSLTVICTFSLVEATYISEGRYPTGPGQNLFHALQWIEMGLLSLAPSAACVFLVFAALSLLARLLYHCVKCLFHVMWCRCFIQESSMPRSLLLNWDPAEELQPVA